MFEGIGGYDLPAKDLGSEKSWACFGVFSIERELRFPGALALTLGLVGGIHCHAHLSSKQNRLL